MPGQHHITCPNPNNPQAPWECSCGARFPHPQIAHRHEKDLSDPPEHMVTFFPAPGYSDDNDHLPRPRPVTLMRSYARSLTHPADLPPLPDLVTNYGFLPACSCGVAFPAATTVAELRRHVTEGNNAVKQGT